MLAIAAPMLAAAALAMSPSASSVCPASDRTPIVSQAPGANASLAPAGPDSLTVCTYNGLANAPPLSVPGVPAFGLVGVGVVADQATVTQLASELDAIPAYRGPPPPCPADFGRRLLAFFGYPSGPGDVVTAELGGCGSLTNGYVERPLGGPVVGQLAALAKPLAKPATFSGYVRLCRAAPSVQWSPCQNQPPSPIPERVEVLNAAGSVVAVARVHGARFTVTVPRSGRYTLKLLAAGTVMTVIDATARPGRTSRVVFTIPVACEPQLLAPPRPWIRSRNSGGFSMICENRTTVTVSSIATRLP